MDRGGGGMDRGGGGGYDHERGGMAPEEGTWRTSRGAPPSRSGGGGGFGDRDVGRMGGGGGGSGMGRESGYDNAPVSTGGRKRLQLQSRTAPPPLPPMAPKEDKVEPAAAPAPAPKPAGPRSNPFGAAQAVDTTQRDKEIEAKAQAAKQTSLRRRDESVRSSKPTAAEGGAETGEEEGGEGGGEAEAEDGQKGGEAAAPADDGDVDEESRPAANKEGNTDSGDAKAKVEPAKPVGRWAALRREGGGDSGPAAGGGGFPRRDRDRDDERRGSGGGGRDGERSSFGRRNDGDSAATGGGGGGFSGGRGMEREPYQPPAPPSGNAFAKRFGNNFDRDSERSFPRPNAGGMGGGGGGGFDRRDDDRRGGMGGGGFERRDDDRRGGGGSGSGFDRRDDGGRMGGGGGGFDRQDDRRGGGGGFDRRDDGRAGGMGMGSSRFSRDNNDDGGAYRRPGAGSPESRSSPPVRSSDGSAGFGGERGGSPSTTSPPLSSLSKMSIKESKGAAVASAVKEAAPEPQPEPEAEPVPEPEPEPEEPKEDPAEVARVSAADALASGKRGTELKELVLAQEKRTTAGALLAAALEGTETPQDLKWMGEDEFGSALKALSAKDSTQQQMGMIYAVVGKCHKMGFPKDGGSAVVQTIFMGMYNDDLCEEEAFLEWKVTVVFSFSVVWNAFFFCCSTLVYICLPIFRLLFFATLEITIDCWANLFFGKSLLAHAKQTASFY